VKLLHPRTPSSPTPNALSALDYCSERLKGAVKSLGSGSSSGYARPELRREAYKTLANFTEELGSSDLLIHTANELAADLSSFACAVST
jgi:hypothetical protein